MGNTESDGNLLLFHLKLIYYILHEMHKTNTWNANRTGPWLQIKSSDADKSTFITPDGGSHYSSSIIMNRIVLCFECGVQFQVGISFVEKNALMHLGYFISTFLHKLTLLVKYFSLIISREFDIEFYRRAHFNGSTCSKLRLILQKAVTFDTDSQWNMKSDWCERALWPRFSSLAAI